MHTHAHQGTTATSHLAVSVSVRSRVKKYRVNWLLEPRAANIIKLVAEQTGKPQGDLASEAILKYLSDPLKRKKEERKQLIQRINELTADIESLESLAAQYGPSLEEKNTREN